MTRLLIHVEGPTEETFVNEVLGPHLAGYGYSVVSARLLGNARQRSRRGGIRSWPVVRKEIVHHLQQASGCIASTMVDYYGLPQSGQRGWPGRAEASRLAFPQKASTIEHLLLADVCGQMGSSFNPDRFVPYVMMHEFEAMLFSDCRAFASGIGYPDLAPSLQAIRDGFASPEQIDDSPVTAPSKRIATLVPAYQKPTQGTLAIQAIGLDTVRAECPHFRAWLKRLERLAGSNRGATNHFTTRQQAGGLFRQL